MNEKLFKTCSLLSLISYETDRNILDMKIENVETVYFKSVKDTEFLLAADEDFLYICFTGTEPSELADWIKDFKLKKIQLKYGKKVHKGFYESYKDIEDHLIKAIEFWKENRKLVLCGHSLGGAVAVVAYHELLEKGYDIETCITFGQPKVGCRKFSDYGRKHMKLYRVVVDIDLVPKLPPFFLNFFHFGEKIILTTKSGFIFGKKFRILTMMSYTRYLFPFLLHVVWLIDMLNFYKYFKSFYYHRMKNYNRLLKIQIDKII